MNTLLEECTNHSKQLKINPKPGTPPISQIRSKIQKIFQDQYTTPKAQKDINQPYNPTPDPYKTLQISTETPKNPLNLKLPKTLKKAQKDQKTAQNHQSKEHSGNSTKSSSQSDSETPRSSSTAKSMLREIHNKQEPSEARSNRSVFDNSDLNPKTAFDWHMLDSPGRECESINWSEKGLIGMGIEGLAGFESALGAGEAENDQKRLKRADDPMRRNMIWGDVGEGVEGAEGPVDAFEVAKMRKHVVSEPNFEVERKRLKNPKIQNSTKNEAKMGKLRVDGSYTKKRKARKASNAKKIPKIAKTGESRKSPKKAIPGKESVSGTERQTTDIKQRVKEAMVRGKAMKEQSKAKMLKRVKVMKTAFRKQSQEAPATRISQRGAQGAIKKHSVSLAQAPTPKNSNSKFLHERPSGGIRGNSKARIAQMGAINQNGGDLGVVSELKTHKKSKTQMKKIVGSKASFVGRVRARTERSTLGTILSVTQLDLGPKNPKKSKNQFFANPGLSHPKPHSKQEKVTKKITKTIRRLSTVTQGASKPQKTQSAKKQNFTPKTRTRVFTGLKKKDLAIDVSVEPKNKLKVHKTAPKMGDTPIPSPARKKEFRAIPGPEMSLETPARVSQTSRAGLAAKNSLSLFSRKMNSTQILAPKNHIFSTLNNTTHSKEPSNQSSPLRSSKIRSKHMISSLYQFPKNSKILSKKAPEKAITRQRISQTLSYATIRPVNTLVSPQIAEMANSYKKWLDQKNSKIHQKLDTSGVLRLSRRSQSSHIERSPSYSHKKSITEAERRRARASMVSPTSAQKLTKTAQNRPPRTLHTTSYSSINQIFSKNQKTGNSVNPSSGVSINARSGINPMNSLSFSSVNNNKGIVRRQQPRKAVSGQKGRIGSDRYSTRSGSGGFTKKTLASFAEISKDGRKRSGTVVGLQGGGEAIRQAVNSVRRKNY